MERDSRREGTVADPVVVIIDRRHQGQRELNSAEVMKLVRRRSQKKVRKGTGSEDDDAG